jgi:MoaA/NifB/PqqE/SkfB family radical SAM enzyme
MDYFCNFNCPYCYYPDKNIRHTLEKKGEIKGKEFLSKLHNCHINMTGGEPFLYPNFIEICTLLTKNENTIGILTNLSSDLIYEFAEKINPKDVIHIRASLHLTELNKFKSKNLFIERYKFLKKKGFNIDVSAVMWPPIFKKFKKIYREFESNGINIIPLSFFGDYNSKSYPRDYTKKEVNIIKKYWDKTNKIFFNGKYNNEVEIIDSKLYLKGSLCLTGLDYAIISPNGDIKRCFSDNLIIGNIYTDKKINLFKVIKPCESEYCTCPWEGYTYSIGKKEEISKKVYKKNKGYIMNILNKLIK